MDFLTCKICFESFTSNELRRPHVLPCGHTLCGDCATQLLVDGEIKCPICQQIYKYQALSQISINCELEDVIERLASKATESGPKLHYGKCDEHEAYKVHYCEAHDIFICCECALAYHLQEGCHRIPIGEVLTNKKADNCKKIDSHISYLHEKCKEIELFDDILKENEQKIKAQIEKHLSDIAELQQKMTIYQKIVLKYTNLSNNFKDWQKQAQSSKNKVKSLLTFQELNNEMGWMESSEFTKQVEDLHKQSYLAILTSEAFGSWVAFHETYVTHTYDGEQRWGRILSRNSCLLMQDLRTDKPHTDATLINMSDVIEQLSTPRHVYLQFSTIDGTLLGRVVIKVNEEAPRQAQQFIDLCIGKKAERYSGKTEMGVIAKGISKERFYLFMENECNDENQSPVFEEENTIAHKPGSVMIYSTYRQDFCILTRNGYTGSWTGPALGDVVIGLPVLESIIKDNLIERDHLKSKVIISETGLIIGAYFDIQKLEKF